VTLKIEIDVPQGATKIDIGPVLEPILARLVRLERMNGYDDLAKDDKYTWKRVKDNERPVLEKHTEKWFSWLIKSRDIDRRLGALSHSSIVAFLKKTNWTKREHTREDEADWDRSAGYPGVQRIEMWDYIFMKKPGWGGSPTPFESSVTARVPFPERYTDEARRIYLVKEMIGNIKKAEREAHYTTSTTEEILLKIEGSLHPLEQLADCAEDK